MSAFYTPSLFKNWANPSAEEDHWRCSKDPEQLVNGTVETPLYSIFYENTIVSRHSRHVHISVRWLSEPPITFKQSLELSLVHSLFSINHAAYSFRTHLSFILRCLLLYVHFLPAWLVWLAFFVPQWIFRALFICLHIPQANFHHPRHNLDTIHRSLNALSGEKSRWQLLSFSLWHMREKGFSTPQGAKSTLI